MKTSSPPSAECETRHHRSWQLLALFIAVLLCGGQSVMAQRPVFVPGTPTELLGTTSSGLSGNFAATEPDGVTRVPVAVVSQSGAGSVYSYYSSGSMYLSLRDSAGGTRSVVLRATGAGGTADLTVALHLVPLKLIDRAGDPEAGYLTSGMVDTVAAAMVPGALVVVKADGRVAVGGPGLPAALQPPGTLSGVAKVAVGGAVGSRRILALKTDGTLVEWGETVAGETAMPAGLAGVTSISAGLSHRLAVTSTGQVVGWGLDTDGQLAIPVGLAGVLQVSCGARHSLALRKDGTVAEWGADHDGPLVQTSAGLRGIAMVAAGKDHSLALSYGGKVTAWGNNSRGQCMAPVTKFETTVLYSIAAGDGESFAIGTNRWLQQWGRGNKFSLASDSPVEGVTAGGDAGVVVSGSKFLDIMPVASRVRTATVGMPFQQYFSSTKYGGMTVTGTLPPGLVLNFERDLVGTPTTPGVYNLTVTLDDNYNNSTTMSVPCQITVAFPVGVNVVSVPPLRVSLGSSKLDNQAGLLLFTGSPVVTGRDLPPGLTVDTAGVLHGRPTRAGRYNSAFLLTSGATTVEAAWPVTVEAVFDHSVMRSTYVEIPTGLTEVRTVAANVNSGWAVHPAGPHTSWTTMSNSDGFNWVLQPYFSTPLVSIRAGNDAAGLDELGNLKSWGGNYTTPGLTRGVVAAAVYDSKVLVLDRSGCVTGWGTGYQPRICNEVLTAVAAGKAHVLGLTTDRTVVAWSTSNSYGQATVPAGLADVVAVAAGWGHSLALRADGTVVGWGLNSSGEATPPAGLSGVIAIAASDFQSAALRGDGTAVLWGRSTDSNGTPLAFVQQLTGLTDIALGQQHILALGGVDDRPPWLSSPREAVTGVAKPFHYRVRTANPATTVTVEGLPEGLTFDAGTRLVTGSTGQEGSFPATVTAWNAAGSDTMTLTIHVVAQPRSAVGLAALQPTVTTPLRSLVTSSYSFGLGLKTDGTVTTWPPDTSLPPPTQLADVTALAAYQYRGIALKADGTLAIWGSDSTPVLDGAMRALTNVVAVQIGDPSPGNYDVVGTVLQRDGTVSRFSNAGPLPVPVAWQGAVALGRGGRHVITSAGTVLGLGDPAEVIPAGLTGVIQVASANYHAVALTSGGTVQAWAISGVGITNGQTTVPAGLSDVIRIGAYNNTSWAVKRDGTLVQWGTPITLPAGLTGVSLAELGGSAAAAILHRNTAPVLDLPRAQRLAAAGTGSTPFLARSHGTGVTYSATGMPPGLGINAATGLFTGAATVAGTHTVSITAVNAYGSETRAMDLVIDGAPKIRGVPKTELALNQNYSALVYATGAPTFTATGLPPGLTIVAATGEIRGFPTQDGTWTAVITATNAYGLDTATWSPTSTTFSRWGTGSLATTPLPAGLGRLRRIAAAEVFLAIRADGSAVLWPETAGVPTPAGLTNVIDIALGTGSYADNSQASVLKEDGTVVTWNFRVATVAPSTITIPGAVALAGPDKVLLRTGGVTGIQTSTSPYLVRRAQQATERPTALHHDGSVSRWKQYPYPSSMVVLPMTDIATLDQAGSDVIGVKRNGTITIVDESGAVVDRGAGALTGIIGVRSGPYACVALTQGRSLAGWGAAAYAVPTGAAGVYDFAVGNGVAVALTSSAANTPLLSTPRYAVTETAGKNGRFHFNITSAGLPSSYAAAGLPAGLTLNTTTGLISGTVQTAGVYQVALSATNAAGSETRPLTLYVNPAHDFLQTWGTGAAEQKVLPPVAEAPRAVAASPAHSLLVHPDGGLLAWGQNTAGELNLPSGLGAVSQVAAGLFWSMALQRDGTTRTWGSNPAVVNFPPAFTGSDNVAVSGKYNHAVVLKADGTVRVGVIDGSHGEAAVPSGLTKVVAVSAGVSFTLALRSDGTVVGWGLNGNGQAAPPAGLSNVAAVAAGTFHSLALRKDGTVVGWGFNYYGEAAAPAGLADVIAISAGDYHSAALKRDGSLVVWGRTTAGAVPAPAGLGPVALASLSGDQNLVVRSSPAAPPVITSPEFALGDGLGVDSFHYQITAANLPTSFSAANLPAGLTLNTATGVISGLLAAPGVYNVTLTASNALGSEQRPLRITAWDATLPVQLSPLSILTGSDVSGRIWSGSYPGTTVTGLPPGLVLNPVTGVYSGQVSQSGNYLVRLSRAGILGPQSVDWTVRCAPLLVWTGSTAEAPLAGAFTSGITSVSLGSNFSYMYYENGVVRSFNAGSVYNNFGVKRIAAGPAGGSAFVKTTTALATDYETTTETGFVDVAAGVGHIAALKSDGSVREWASLAYFQSFPRTVPANLGVVTALAAGQDYTLALRANGTVAAWQLSAPSASGFVDSGQTVVPAGLTDVVAVTAGPYHAAALRRTGDVVAWGELVRSAVPPGLSGVAAIAAGYDATLAAKTDGTIALWGATTAMPDMAVTTAKGVAASGARFAVFTKSKPDLIASRTLSATVGAAFSLPLCTPETARSVIATPMPFASGISQGASLTGTPASTGAYRTTITAENSLGTVQSVVTVLAAPNPAAARAAFATWQTAQWPGAADAAPAAAGADPDSDGVMNLLEYLTGGDPNQPGAQSLQLARDGEGFVLILPVLAASSAGVIIYAEFADEPSFDSLLSTVVNPDTAPIPDRPGWMQMTFTDPAPAATPHRFGRVMAVLP